MNRNKIPQAALDRFYALRDEEDLIQRSLMGQAGTSIPKIFNDSNDYIINPSSVGTGIMSRMAETDDTVSSAIQFKILMILSKIGEYHHDDEEIKKFVNGFLKKLRNPTWAASMESMLSAYCYGFSVSEAVFGIDDQGRKIPVRIPTYHPSTMAFEVDPSGLITQEGVLQFVYQYSQYSNPNVAWSAIDAGYRVVNPFQTPQDRLMPRRIPFISHYGMVRIPRRKCIHLVNQQMFSFGSPYGKTSVRTAHLPWQLKVFILKQVGIGAKRQATPKIWGTAPTGGIQVEYKTPDGRIKSGSPTEILNDILSRAETDDSITTGPEKDGYKLQVLEASANLEGMMNVVDKLDTKIFRCFLLPSLVMTDGQAGSRALGDKHFQIVDKIAENDAKGFGETVVNDLIARVIYENYGKQDDYGHFMQRESSVEERERLANMFATLTSAQIAKPYVKNDLDYMRSAVGLPMDTDTTFDPAQRDKHEEPDGDEQQGDGTENAAGRFPLPKDTKSESAGVRG